MQDGLTVLFRLPELIKGNSVQWTFWFDEAGKVTKSMPDLFEGEDEKQ
jgi:hypothetical protein